MGRGLESILRVQYDGHHLCRDGAIGAHLHDIQVVAEFSLKD